jgi:peptidoglycan/xylan/chitin deacetylase (PgdA/CDA1 family)
MPALFKRQLRSAADQAARWLGILERRERDAARDLTILTYHRVLGAERSAAYPFGSLAMPIGAFRDQLRWFAAHYEVLPLAQALERIQSTTRSARPLLALTFDDGYSDSDDAAQELEQVGMRGTFFVTTGFVGTRGLLWFDRAVLLFAEVSERVRREIVLQVCGVRNLDRLPNAGSSPARWTAHLKRLGPAQRAAILAALECTVGGPPAVDGYQALSVAQLRALHARGHEIGSHSVSHGLLPELDDVALRDEVENARDALGAWIGTTVSGFCYPNGDCDARVVAAVARAGHRYACTTRDGLHRPGDDPFLIRRVDVVPERALDGSRQFAATALRREMCGLYRSPDRRVRRRMSAT